MNLTSGSRRIVSRIFLSLFIITIDIGVYIFFGLALMRYDDFYDESKGEYWSWQSMDAIDKTITVSFQVWNILNLLLLFFLVRWILKKMWKRQEV